MPKLSDTQSTLLSAAAQRADRNLLPLSLPPNPRMRSSSSVP